MAPVPGSFSQEYFHGALTSITYCLTITKYSQEYFHGALASIAYYLSITKYSQENFCAALGNCERLAQQSFSCLQYVTTIHTIGII